MRGKRTNQIPRGSYDRGEPEINLLLAVLAQAKSDASATIPKIISNQYQRERKAFILSAKEMWRDFQKTRFYDKRTVAPLEVAWWVYDYIRMLRNPS